MTVAPTMLLDANVVSYFFNASRKQELGTIAQVLSLAVVEEVHQEALNHKKRGDEYRKWQLSSGLTVRSLAVGGVGSVCLGTLRGGSNDMKDLGEHASIALAVEDPSLLLVTNDKGGAWLGLRELVAPGERVIRIWSFLQRAQVAANLGATAVKAIAESAHLKNDEPTWWNAWLATLPP